jgi:uncharacterized protein YndB with AHSA1/START domain
MSEQFDVRWEGELPAPPAQVWDAVTKHAAGWLWEIRYEPRVGGAEQGLTVKGGLVTAWDPHQHFATRAQDGDAHNELDYRLEPRPGGTYLRYRHLGVAGSPAEVDACEQHTAFYYHSLGEYLRHFAGRDAAYFTVDAPEVSAHNGLATLRTALGLPDNTAVGDEVRLTPAGLPPVEGVVDYATGPFLGIRTDDALYRLYGRDAWGWPAGVGVHLFAQNADAHGAKKAWDQWLTDTFTTTEAGTR